MDFTSQLPVTSSHCTEWQKPGHNASPGHWHALTRSDPCLRGLLCRSSREKILSCSTTHATGCIQVKRHRSWWCSGSGGHSNDETLQVRVQTHPQKGGHLGTLRHTKVPKTGCAPTLRNAASLQKHRSVARKARVKQVRPWTYSAYMHLFVQNWLLGTRAAKTLIPIGSLHRERRKETILLNVCTFT